MKKSATLIYGIIVLSMVVSGVVLSSEAVFADDVVDNINFTVPISCTISGTGMNTHNATINNGQYNSAIGETTLKTLCNDSEGFAIYAIGFTDNTDGKNVLTSSALGSNHDIVTGTATSGNTSNWAMKLTAVTNPTPTYPVTIENSFDAFHAVPNEHTLVASRSSATDIGTSAEGASFKTTYQAYISPTQVAGTYTGQVKYILVHPSNADAIWTLSFNASGGSGAPSAMKGFEVGNSYSFTIPDTEPTKSGYIFLGWSESSSATTPDYESGDTYTATSANATLYAVWMEEKIVSIVYNGNGSTAGSATAFHHYSHENVEYGDTVHLLSSNYSRTGYGYAGWTTTPLNPNAANFESQLAAMVASSEVYGPAQTIDVDGAFLMNADANDQITLYALWIPVARSSSNAELTFQTANLFTTTLADGTTLSSKSAGYVTALKDVRDNEVYAITKISDGSWWMIENLRLNPGTANITSANTNNPSSAFLSEITNIQSTDTWCQDEYTASCTDVARYNTSNLDRSLIAAPDNYDDQIMSLSNTQWYSYGVYYNWYTATAGYGTQNLRGYWDDTASMMILRIVDGDICPNGWRLPIAKNNLSKDYDYIEPGSIMSLIGVMGGEGDMVYDEVSTNYPYNFVRSGEYDGYSQVGRGYNMDSFTSFHSSTVGYSDYDDPNGIIISYYDYYGFLNNINRYGGFAARCVATP